MKGLLFLSFTCCPLFFRCVHMRSPGRTPRCYLLSFLMCHLSYTQQISISNQHHSLYPPCLMVKNHPENPFSVPTINFHRIQHSLKPLESKLETQWFGSNHFNQRSLLCCSCAGVNSGAPKVSKLTCKIRCGYSETHSSYLTKYVNSCCGWLSNYNRVCRCH